MNELGYTRTETAIGRVFIAATPRGLCSLRLLQGEERREIRDALTSLHKRFPGLTACEDDQGLAALAGQVRRVIDGRLGAGAVPIDMSGTPFQCKVWKALLRIPWGSTCSYAELARKAGSPRAVRAAATACAMNPIAFVVPCHRIVASDGGLGGYYYGLQFKRRLLDREQAG